MNDESPQHPSSDDYKTAPALPGTGHAERPRHARAADPTTQAKHEESVQKYPELDLSRDEYVIAVVRRHPIGLVFIWSFVTFLAIIVFAAIAWYGANTAFIQDTLLLPFSLPGTGLLWPLGLFFTAFLALGGIIASYVYVDNRFYLTNESVFQFLRSGILQHKMQVINLINVEDASHEQNGILQNLFNYGTLRLSTQGEETTYHFYFVANPRKLVGVVNDASEKAVRRLEGFPAGEY